MYARITHRRGRRTTRHALLAEHLLAGVGHLAARLEWLGAFGASEALLVIRLAHGTDHLALHIQLAGGTFGAIQPLVVRYTIVGAILGEEAAGG